MRIIAAAAAAAWLAVALANLNVYRAYRSWRAELASRIDEASERTTLQARWDLAPEPSVDARTADLLVMGTTLCACALIAWWAVLVTRNREAWYGSSAPAVVPFRRRRNGAASSTAAGHASPWTREARRTMIRPIWLAVPMFLVLVGTWFERMVIAMGEPARVPADVKIDGAIAEARWLMSVAWIQAVGVLPALLVIAVTTRQHLKRLRAGLVDQAE
ncbi:hypothetical protein [Yinghuangia seranimata]|uniref:hypothetical protein n=1 Tax=Yinghuangia seranimata TaxID=408067 RepID=UPI00248CAEB0|nr:hypothetical protein [Yinghuangia seranimata]MDI2125720.1 hypothetical protein [Yinghuangia seranimata]